VQIRGSQPFGGSEITVHTGLVMITIPCHAESSRTKLQSLRRHLAKRLIYHVKLLARSSRSVCQSQSQHNDNSMKSIFGIEIPDSLRELTDPKRSALIVYDMRVGIIGQSKMVLQLRTE
jgi:hypothetical protein